MLSLMFWTTEYWCYEELEEREQEVKENYPPEQEGGGAETEEERKETFRKEKGWNRRNTEGKYF